jgi:hypothetical protein
MREAKRLLADVEDARKESLAKSECGTKDKLGLERPPADNGAPQSMSPKCKSAYDWDAFTVE